MPLSDTMLVGISRQENLPLVEITNLFANTAEDYSTEEDAHTLVNAYKRYKQESGGDSEQAIAAMKSFSPSQETVASLNKTPGQVEISTNEDVFSYNTVGMSGSNVPKSAFIDSLFGQASEAGQQVIQASDKQALDLSALTMQFQQDTKRVVDLTQQEGVDQSAVFTAQAAAESARGFQSAKVLNSLHINIGDVDDLSAQLINALVRDTPALQALREDITQKQAQIPQFYDNPIGWVVGHMALKGEINQHNALQVQVEGEKTKLSGLVSAANELDGANVAKLNMMKATESLAKATLARTQADQAAAKIQQQSVSVNAALLSRNLEAAKARYGVIQDQIRLLEYDQNSQDRKLDRDYKHDILTKQKEAEAIDLQMTNDVGALLGYPPLQSIQQYNKLPIQIKNVYQIVKNSSGTKFGTDVVPAINLVGSGNINAMSENMKTVYEIANSVLTEAKNKHSATLDPQFDGKNKAEQELQLSTEVRQSFKDMSLNTDKKPVSGIRRPNPYEMPSISIMLQNSEIANSKLGVMLNKLQEQSPGTVVDDHRVVATVKEDLRRPDSLYGGSYEEAARDIQRFFVYAKYYTNKGMNFTAWNLPEQEVYRFDNVDWSNYAKVIPALTGSNILSRAFQGLEKVFREPMQVPVPGDVRGAGRF